MKALIVDDDKYVWMGLRKLIPWDSVHFTEVLWAENGSLAYDTSMKTHPDLIITDVKMPIMNGIDLCKKISESDIETYVIMLSAYDDFEFARAALKYNVKDYILKPLDEESIKQLITKIELIVSEHQRKQDFRRIVYSKELSNRIANSLKESNIDDIILLFQHDLPSMQLEQNEFKDCGLLLIDLLFDYLEKIGYCGNETINKKRADAVEYVLNTKIFTDIFDYTYNLYLDILESHSAKRPGGNLLVNEMCLYVHKNYMKANLSVAKIANDLHIAPGYAGPLFKKHMNVRLNTYLNNLRIEESCNLLKDISLKVSNVGEMVGIPDTNHFCKLFKKLKGISPTEYRHIHFQSNTQ